MSSAAATVTRVRTALADAFDSVDDWFEQPEPLRRFRPADGGWTIDEVLEHVGLTTHYLLIIIRRQAQKAVRKAASADSHASGASDFDTLAAIADPGAFTWIRPEHMEPSGSAPPADVRALLRQQKNDCLEILNALRRGEGWLVRVGMSVHGLGKLDLYQWLFFVAQHARRHVAQMDGNAREYRESASAKVPG